MFSPSYYRQYTNWTGVELVAYANTYLEATSQAYLLLARQILLIARQFS